MEVLVLADSPVHVPRAHHLVRMHELQVLTLPLRRGIGQAIEIGQDALELHGVRSPYGIRSEEHTSELQSLMRISYAVFCLKKKKKKHIKIHNKTLRKK